MLTHILARRVVEENNLNFKWTAGGRKLGEKAIDYAKQADVCTFQSVSRLVGG